MNLVINLPPELETELTAEADRLGLTLPDYALRVLAGGRVPGPTPRTGADLIAYWQGEGVVGMRPDITDSLAHAEKLRNEAQRRTP